MVSFFCTITNTKLKKDLYFKIGRATCVYHRNYKLSFLDKKRVTLRITTKLLVKLNKENDISRKCSKHNNIKKNFGKRRLLINIVHSCCDNYKQCCNHRECIQEKGNQNT